MRSRIGLRLRAHTLELELAFSDDRTPTPSSAVRKSVCQEARRYSPSVIDLSPTASCFLISASTSRSSIAFSASAVISPFSRLPRASRSAVRTQTGCRRDRRGRAAWFVGSCRYSTFRFPVARSLCPRPSPSSSRTPHRAGGTSCRSPAQRRSARAEHEPRRRGCVRRPVSAVSTAISDRSMTPRMMVLDGSSFSTARSSFGCAASMDTCSAAECSSSGRNE